MNYRQKIGEFGEILAKKYLIRHGYKILAKNIKTSYFELDIIAKKDNLHVFIEVKTRTSEIFGEADEAISAKKIINMKKGALRYIIYNKIDENLIRFDFISVDINREKKTAKIKHYKDII